LALRRGSSTEAARTSSAGAAASATGRKRRDSSGSVAHIAVASYSAGGRPSRKAGTAAVFGTTVGSSIRMGFGRAAALVATLVAALAAGVVAVRAVREQRGQMAGWSDCRPSFVLFSVKAVTLAVAANLLLIQN